jgi:hypothetical protein
MNFGGTLRAGFLACEKGRSKSGEIVNSAADASRLIFQNHSYPTFFDTGPRRAAARRAKVAERQRLNTVCRSTLQWRECSRITLCAFFLTARPTSGRPVADDTTRSPSEVGIYATSSRATRRPPRSAPLFSQTEYPALGELRVTAANRVKEVSAKRQNLS